MAALEKRLEKLLSIPAGSIKIFVLLLPPVYGFWLYAFAKHVVKDISSRNIILLLISILIPVLTICTLSVFYYLFSPDIADILIFSGFAWFVLSRILAMLLSYHSLQFEQNNFYTNSPKPGFIDYYVRFFLLCNWWVGVWSLQKIANIYMEAEVNIPTEEEKS